MKKKLLSIIFIVIFSVRGFSQDPFYKYSLDLNKVQNDQLSIVLECGKINASEVIFYMPKIVPGTYRYSDYGKFVHNLKAYDKAGKTLSVTKTSDNSWNIKNAASLTRITYDVEDTWDSEIPNEVFSMAGTNFEAGKNFVFNTCGIFGYLDKLKEKEFQLNITKPAGFYGSTGLTPVSSGERSDVFRCTNADQLYDSPIMYCIPDTTTITVGSSKVLVSVYSPHKLVHAAFMAENLKQILVGANQYLGGKLPVDKYAFIYYFNGEQKPFVTSGAWEHSYSSFYSLEEQPQAQAIASWVDMSAHEFFHIVTPLTISSKEVKQFDFNEPKLSEHLWLYEGSTEYYAHHMQVRTGLISPAQFLQKLAEKINYSRTNLNDTLSFTELSRLSAGKWKDEYVNVYMKGALISASLDLYLLKLSGGNYGLTNLKHDLGVRFGKDRYFEDDKLFDVITELTYPQIRNFFRMYVEGNTPIPYEEFFGMAGVTYIPKRTIKSFTLGGFQVGQSPEGTILITTIEKMNEFGKKMGYQKDDELVSINNEKTDATNFGQVLQAFYAGTKEGENVVVVVNRKNAAGVKTQLTLSGPAMMVPKTEAHKLELNNKATAEQLKIRNAWLGNSMPVNEPVPAADKNDVSTIDQVINAVYGVISGPPGERNWTRFQSLFYPGAYMGAKAPDGALKKFSPGEYTKMNAPMFKQFGFYEKEVNRVANQFGSIAQVFTTYEFTLETPTPVKQRGINSVELVFENGRWWILSLVWDDETKTNPIPPQYLLNK